LRPWEIADLTPWQFNMLTEYAQEIEARRAYPIAQLEATLRNVMGGKPKAGEGGKALDPRSMYTADELLPPYARFLDDMGGWTPEAAREAVELYMDLPQWLVDELPWAYLERIA